MTTDEQAIAEVVDRFFGAFRSGPESDARLDALPDLFLPGAVVVKTCGDEPVATDVATFVAPRRALLGSGRLQDFSEWHVDGRTEVFGDVAHHFGTYAKAWVEDGVRHEGRGAKTLQLVRTRAGWRITAVAWDDER